MWKPTSGTTCLFFNTNSSMLKHTFNNIKSANFYYPNTTLNHSLLSVNNVRVSVIKNQKLYNKCNKVRFIATSATSYNDSKPLGTDTMSQICHPPANVSENAHIPFKVKPKHVEKSIRSVLEKYIAGESVTFKQLKDPYVALTKPHLTFLIMLSSICSYILAPNATDVPTFLALTVGTLLASGAANAINMGREPNFDSQMSRTSTRPVVTGLVKPKEAFTFAAVTGTIGCGILYVGVNPIVAALGATNLVLYAWTYTSLKRKSIVNTWVGAVVGAIPPLMGWGACGSLADPGAWCLAALLYAWQFPHFNALSHNIKDEYKRAGYVMTAFVNPKLNARVALRYSLLMFPICFAMCYYGVCDPFFAIDSSIFNAWMAYTSFRFWLQQRQNYSSKILACGGASKEAIQSANGWAKKTFWSSIWQLPVVLVLAMLHKTGQWDRFFNKEKKMS